MDLEPLREAIRRYKLMAIWSDSITVVSAEQRQSRAHMRAIEAKQTYIRLMGAPANDGGLKYREWAIKKALGLRTSKRHTAQAIGGKHWQSWGAG